MAKITYFQAKVYEEKKRHVTSATLIVSWEVPYEEVCLFCYVTGEEHIVIGGQRQGRNTWELKAYNIGEVKPIIFQMYFYFH